MEENFEQPQVPQTTNPQNGELDKLYSVVSQAGLYTKSKDEFKTKYSTPESIDKLYSVASQAGLYTKSKDDFYSKYYPDLGKKVSAQNPILTQDLSFKNLSKVLPTGGKPVEDVSEIDNISSSIKKGQLQGKIANTIPLGRVPNAEELGKIAEYQKELQSIPTSENEQAFQNEGLAIFKNPVKGAKFLAETISSSLSSLFESGKRTVPAAVGIGAVAGAPFAGIGAVAGAGTGLTAGLTTAGYNISTSQKLLELLQDEGIDVTDKNSLIKAFSDENKMAALRSKANKYAIPIAIFDVASAGIGGKLIGGAAGKSIAKKALAGLGEAAIQSFGGMGGELSGQLASGQKVDWNEVAIEGISSLATDAPDVAIGAIRERAKASSNNKTIARQVATLGKEAGIEDATHNLNRDLANGIISEEEHAQGLEFAQKAAEVSSKIPDTVLPENKATSIELIINREQTKAEIEQLEVEKQQVDEAYHSELDEAIKAKQQQVENINKEILGLSKGVTVIKPQENQPIETIGIGGIENKPETNKSGVSVILPTQNKKPDIVENKKVEVTPLSENISIFDEKVKNDKKAEVSKISEINDRIQDLEYDEATLSKSERQELQELRGERNNYLRGVEKQLQDISSRYGGETKYETFSRQDRQQWELLQRELQMGDKGRTIGKQTDNEVGDVQGGVGDNNALIKNIGDSSRDDKKQNKEGGVSGSGDTDAINENRRNIQQNSAQRAENIIQGENDEYNGDFRIDKNTEIGSSKETTKRNGNRTGGRNANEKRIKPNELSRGNDVNRESSKNIGDSQEYIDEQDKKGDVGRGSGEYATNKKTRDKQETPKEQVKPIESKPTKEGKQPDATSEVEVIETPSSRTSGEEVKDKEQKSSKPKKTESVTSIEPPFTLIKTELERARTRVGLGDYEKEIVTDERAAKEAENDIKEWKEKGVYNKEIDKIIEDANDGKISDLGNNVLAQHIADLEVTGKSLDRFSKEYDKNRAELKRAIDAGDSLRSAAGRILGRDLKVFGEEVQSVQDIEMQMMQDTDTDILTKEQKIEAEKRFNEYKEVADKEAKLRVEAEAEIEKLKAELEIAKAKKAATPTTKKTKGDYQAERKDIVKSIKDKWNKAGNDGTLTAVPIPYAKQLAAIAPDVAKLLNSYITEFKERGIDITLEKARELLKKDINEAGIEVSDEDVRGLIAGRFNEKKQTKSELVTKRQDLVAEEKLLLEIEELEKGGVPKTEIGKRKRNQKFKELRDRIKELKKIGLAENIELPSELDEQQKKFETAIKTQIANNKKEQAKIEEKIKNKDYSEDEKKSKIIDNPLLKKNNPKLYEEYLQAIEDKYNAKLKLEKDRIDDKIKNRSGLDKIKDWANIAFTTTQSTVAGFDQSMVMVQLLGHTLSHPINTAKFARDSFKDMFSKRFFDRRMATLHNTVLWDTIEKSGLVIYEPRSFKAELRAEQHGGDKNLWNKSFVIGGKKYSIGQAFERSTTGFINNARISLFLNGVEKLQQQGKTFENSPKEYEALARVCNEWTGHGKVQRHIQMGSELVNKVIWSPKMLASTFNILGLGDLARPIETTKEIGRSLGVNIKESGNTKGFYSSLTPKQRAFMRNEMLRALGTASLLIGTGMLTGAIDDFDFDPRSSGFGSVTKGDITVNLFGRFASAMRTIVQVLGGEKKTDKGVYTIGEKYGSKKTEDVLIGGFGRGKMTPAAGMAYDYFLNNKKNYYTEEKVTPTYMAKNLAVPMSLQGAVKDVFQSDEKLVGLAKTISKSYGFDVKDKADYKESLKIKKENKILERKEKIRKLRETLKKANKKP